MEQNHSTAGIINKITGNGLNKVILLLLLTIFVRISIVQKEKTS
jgi:hypothetical protein